MADGKQFVPEKKDKYADLEEEWMGNIRSMSPDEINDRIAESARLIAQKQQHMKTDPEILQAKHKVKELTEDDRTDIKMAKKRIDFMDEVLNEKGKG